MERNPPPTRTLHTIERLQGWSMLGFYPFEHLYYLRAHNLIPTSIPSFSAILGRSSKRISFDENRLIIWSCRFWLLYVVLQFAHLREDRKLLLTRQKNLRKGKGFSAEDKEDLRNRWDAFWNEFVANTANFPLALHWFVPFNMYVIHAYWPFLRSLESGLFTNDVSESSHYQFCVADSFCRFGSPSSASSMVLLHSEVAGERRLCRLPKPLHPVIFRKLLNKWRKSSTSDRVILDRCTHSHYTREARLLFGLCQKY